MLPSPSRLRPLDETFPAETRGELRLVPRENRVAVILNARAKRVTARVREAFQSVVPADDLFMSSSFEEAELHARTIIERRYNTVLAGGGDGTITNTMNMLLRASESMRGARHSLPDIAILRLGTGNGLAHMTGAGKPLDDVARMLSGERPAAHPLRLIQDGRSGWVFPFCSMGYDAQVLNDFVDQHNAAKTAFGKKLAKSLAGYFFAVGTRTIPHEMTAEKARVRIVATGRSSIIDPETDEEVPLEKGAVLFEGPARSISAGSSPYYGYGLCVHPFSRRRTDRFHLRVSTAPIGYLLSHLPSLWNGSLRTPYLTDFLTEGVRIESTVPMPLQMAGDARGQTDHLELNLSDRAFRFLEGTKASS